MIAEAANIIADREQHLVEKGELLAEKDRRIAQLENDVAGERSWVRQLESAATPPVEAMPVTAVRPNGEIVEVMHAVGRPS